VAVDGPVSQREADRHLQVIRAIFEAASQQAGAADPQETGHQLQIVFMGAMVATSRGDHDTAQRVRTMTELLLESSR
jgi:hypothetical protein